MNLIIIREKPLSYILLTLVILFLVFSILTGIDKVELLFEIMLLIICPIIILIASVLFINNFKCKKIRAHYFLLSLLIIITLIVTGQIIIRILNV